MKLRSHAKINYSLDITGKREDGYHTVMTVMQRLSFFDELEFKLEENRATSEPQIEIHTNRPFLPTDERNLAYKAVTLILDYLKEKGNPFQGKIIIDIIKHIPVSAGLAGGSGNAAITLIALNRLLNLNLSTRKLIDIGKELGADVAFTILVENTRYRTALGEGIGDVLTPIKSKFHRHILLVKPNFGVSTKEVYMGIDEKEIGKHPNTEELINALESSDAEAVYENMVNVLENYTLEEYPEVNRLKNIVSGTNHVKKVLMSGSGPTIIGFYDEKYFAKAACDELRSLGYEAYWTETSK